MPAEVALPSSGIKRLQPPLGKALGGKTGRGRNWNYESSKPHIHRVTDRRAHRITARGSGVCEGGRNTARAEIATLGISDGCRGIRTNRGFDGSAARAIFDRKVKAPNEKEGNAQSHRADEQRDQDRRDNSELYRRGPSLIAA